MAYKGKYPNRIAGYASTNVAGIYSLTTNAGTHHYVTVRACLAHGVRNSMEQSLGADLVLVPWAHATLAAAMAAL